MKKSIFFCILSCIILGCAGCADENASDPFSDISSDRKEETVIAPPELEESTITEDCPKEESSEDSRYPEKEEGSDNWTFIY